MHSRSRAAAGRPAGVLLALAFLAGCGGPASAPSPDTRTAAAESPAGPPTTPAEPSASTASPSPSPSRSTRGRLGRPDDLAVGLTSPWGVAPLRDGSLLVGERDTGRIKRVSDGRISDVTRLEAVRPGGEGGLLGLALTPDEKTLYAYFTAAQDNRIVSMTWDGSKLGSPKVILNGIRKAGRHNGGGLVVGPDGFLWASTGDAVDSSQAQDENSLGGKVLRLTLAGKPAPGNPFGNAVYSYGHRNVEGLAFDDAGRLWASEFGEQTWDELNLITRGADYGWPLVEGSGKAKGMTNPKLVWRTSEASPSGLAYWQGELWMAGLRGQRLWEIPLSGTSVGDPVSHFRGDYGRLRSVAASRDGTTLLLGTSNTDGRGQPTRGDDRLMEVSR